MHRNMRPCAGATLWTISFLCLLLMSSCSRTAKVRRYLARSEQLCEQARNAMLNGNAVEALSLAEKAETMAKRAVDLTDSGPGGERATRCGNAAARLGLGMKAPSGAVLLWIYTVAEEDLDLAVRLFDFSDIVEAVDLSPSGMNRSEWRKETERAIRESTRKSIQNHSEVFSQVSCVVTQEELHGNEATVECEFGLLKQRRPVTFWMRRKDGLWRIRDFSLSGHRATTLFASLAKEVPDSAEPSHFLEGKGVFEAFSTVEGAASIDPVFSKRDFQHHYVRAVHPLTLTRGEEQIVLEANGIAKVIDQFQDSSGHTLLLIRTTEADLSHCAIGEVPTTEVQPLGTDESEIWGITSENAVHNRGS